MHQEVINDRLKKLAYCKGKGKGTKISLIRQTFFNAYYVLGTVPDAVIGKMLERVWDGRAGDRPL